MVEKTINSFFKKRCPQSVEHNTNAEPSQSAIGTSTIEPKTRALKSPRVELKAFDPSTCI